MMESYKTSRKGRLPGAFFSNHKIHAQLLSDIVIGFYEYFI